MPLKEIKQDLQKKDSKTIKREHDKTAYNVWESIEDKSKKPDKKWKKNEDKMIPTRKKAIVIGAISVSVVVFLLLAITSFVYFQKGFFSQDRVSLMTQAPKTIDSNTLTEITFSYNNDNRANLNDAKIIVHFGDYFFPQDNQQNFEKVSKNQGVITIGDIEGKEKNTFKIEGHFSGPEGSVDDVLGTLRYAPERTNVRYDTQSRASTVIMSSPISINISSPVEIVSGNLMDIRIVVKNTSQNNISNLKLTMDIPDSFSVYNTEPMTTRENTWLISNIESNSEKVIHVRGNIEAPVGTVQTFHVEVGSQEDEGKYIIYARGEYSPVIVSSPFLVKQEIENINNNVVYAGDNLKYKISFINNSEIPLRDAIVSVQFDGEVLDFANLQLNEKGDYDEANKKITWKASDVEALKLLKPKESGFVTFDVPVLKRLPIETINDYHFTITTLASIDSEDIPSELRENKTVLSNVLTVPVGAKVLFDSELKHKDGEMPPKVGKKTIYDVTFVINNVNNDIGDTVIIAALPTYVSFEGGEGIELNERTNEITWKAGDIVHGAGITSNKISKTFSVGIIPSIDQIDSIPVLIKEQVLTAKDLFTGMSIQEFGNEITTRKAGESNSMSAVQP